MSDISSANITKSRKEWRKLVKKLRRKKIRQKRAKERELTDKDSKQDANLKNEIEPNASSNEQDLRYLQWLKDEKEAQLIWQQQENLRKDQEIKKVKAQEKIKQEWEAARQKKQEQQNELERRQIELHKKIETFLSGSGEAPAELLAFSETKPGKELCPFFSKVAACRYGQACSRNHKIPGISKVIVIPNFYTHFTFNQSSVAEYDTDVGLEFGEKEMHNHFREFFDDVVGELENYGDISMVHVCKNSEPHLRGNVYVEYREERFALKAARSLNARWYGGRQLTVSLATISDWTHAICGYSHRGKCPKGSECNFLHIFSNPRGDYGPWRKEKFSTPRSWRWSESPERISTRKSERRHSERGSRQRDKHHSSTRSRGEDHSSTRSRGEDHSSTRSRGEDHSSTRSRGEDRHDKNRRSKKYRISSERHNDRDGSRKENKYRKKDHHSKHWNSPNVHLSPHNYSS